MKRPEFMNDIHIIIYKKGNSLLLYVLYFAPSLHHHVVTSLHARACSFLLFGLWGCFEVNVEKIMKCLKWTSLVWSQLFVGGGGGVFSQFIRPGSYGSHFVKCYILCKHFLIKTNLCFNSSLLLLRATLAVSLYAFTIMWHHWMC